jgi:hypothetical protein
MTPKQGPREPAEMREPEPSGPARDTHDVKAAAETHDTPPLEWTVNPWKERPRNAILAVLFFLLAGGLLLRMDIARINSVVLGLALMLSLSPALVVLRCRVDERGIARRLLFVWDRRPWDRVGRVRLGRHSLWVSSHATPTWLDAFRGLVLPFRGTPEETADLRSELRQRLGEHGLQA